LVRGRLVGRLGNRPGPVIVHVFRQVGTSTGTSGRISARKCL
jgi:hypothetical protein